MTVDEYHALTEAGILDRVELIEGVVMMGRYPLAFSAEQVAAAAGLGIELPGPTGSSQADTRAPAPRTAGGA